MGKKVMVLTSMRTGSTWLTFIIRNLLNMRAGFAADFEEVERLWKFNAIAKAHKFTPEEVFEKYPSAFIVTSVRNPKGRASSQLYFQPPYTKEALDKIIKNRLSWSAQKQLDRMWKGFSTKNIRIQRKPHYVWTTYEWMKEDIHREVKKLSRFFGLIKTDKQIDKIVKRAQKESEFIGIVRKGKVDSWKEETFKEKLNTLDKYQEMYYTVLGKEE